MSRLESASRDVFLVKKSLAMLISAVIFLKFEIYIYYRKVVLSLIPEGISDFVKLLIWSIIL